MLIINIITILVLSLIFYQDMKYRAIHWLFFPVLATLFIIYGLLKIPAISYLKECVFNLLFLLIQMVLLLAYYYRRRRSIRAILNVFIGAGDIVLLVSIAFAFSRINFIAFYLTGMIFSLLIWLAIQFFSSQKKNLVPLAGLISFYMILFVSGDIFSWQLERLNDNFLIHLIYG